MQFTIYLNKEINTPQGKVSALIVDAYHCDALTVKDMISFRQEHFGNTVWGALNVNVVDCILPNFDSQLELKQSLLQDAKN